MAVTSLVYGGLTQLGLVPRYDSLPGMKAVDLFILVYLFISISFCVVWMLGPGVRAKRNEVQYWFRYVFRQSDQAGVRLFSALTLVMIAVGSFFLYVYGLFQRDALLFMVFVLGFPMLLDFFPQMPRRFVIPTNVESIDEILEALGFDYGHPQRAAALSALEDYNRDIGTQKQRESFWSDPSAVTPANYALRIEIPPVVHQMVLDDSAIDAGRYTSPPPKQPESEKLAEEQTGVSNDAPAQLPEQVVPIASDVPGNDQPLWG